jgi:hypothetical protein
MTRCKEPCCEALTETRTRKMQPASFWREGNPRLSTGVVVAKPSAGGKIGGNGSLVNVGLQKVRAVAKLWFAFQR